VRPLAWCSRPRDSAALLDGALLTNADCVAFLQWALPRLGLRWQGFRRVRRQVCRRVSRRIADLKLREAGAYRAYLEENDEEWDMLAALCRVTISRFWRDRAVFEALRDEVLPELGPTVSAWSAGCASGEEPYSLALAAVEAGVEIRLIATDVDPVLLERARAACYPASSLRGLPADLRERAFEAGCLRSEYREPVEFRRHDVRAGAPGGPFDVVLCRNLVFTYFGEELQREVGRDIARSLRAGGALVVGAHETPTEGLNRFEPWPAARSVYRRQDTSPHPDTGMAC
jgi:chemotaxis protein methyltransferase CheR